MLTISNRKSFNNFNMIRLCVVFIYFFFFKILTLNAQSGFVSMGGNVSGSDGQYSYSSGQIFYNQVNSSSNYLIQGVQQPYSNSFLVNLGNDTMICVGDTLILNAGSTGSSFLWSDNTTGNTLPIYQTGTYSVTVTLGGVSVSDTIAVSVNPLPPVSIFGLDSFYCGTSISTIHITGNQSPNGTFSGNFITDNVPQYLTVYAKIFVDQNIA